MVTPAGYAARRRILSGDRSGSQKSAAQTRTETRTQSIPLEQNPITLVHILLP